MFSCGIVFTSYVMLLNFSCRKCAFSFLYLEFHSMRHMKKSSDITCCRLSGNCKIVFELKLTYYYLLMRDTIYHLQYFFITMGSIRLFEGSLQIIQLFIILWSPKLVFIIYVVSYDNDRRNGLFLFYPCP